MTEKNSQAESEGEDLGYRPTLDWTIMVYLAGDNNLSANSISILQDLEDATTSSSQVRVLAC